MSNPVRQVAPVAPVQKPGNSRMSLDAIQSSGSRERPYRVVLYGVHGVGKSSFAAGAPSPVFLPTEDGLSKINVKAFPVPETWGDVLAAVNVLMTQQHSFKTFVIDTLDWAEKLCWAEVCRIHRKDSIEGFDYGKGFVFANDLWRKLLDQLDKLSRVKGMHIIALAHAATRKMDDPIAGAPIDRYSMKLNQKTGDLWSEWADSLLFARHDWRAVKATKFKNKGDYSGNRVILSVWSPSFDAKDRLGLPEAIPLSWPDFADAAAAGGAAGVARVQKELDEVIAKLPESEREKAIKARDDWAGNDRYRLAQLLNRARVKVADAEAEAAEGSEPDMPADGQDPESGSNG